MTDKEEVKQTSSRQEEVFFSGLGGDPKRDSVTVNQTSLQCFGSYFTNILTITSLLPGYMVYFICIHQCVLMFICPLVANIKAAHLQRLPRVRFDILWYKFISARRKELQEVGRIALSLFIRVNWNRI